jgi:3-dehydroquinate synthase
MGRPSDLASFASSKKALHGDCIVQRISVDFDYPVRFTRHCLEPGNPSLRLAIARREPDRRHRLVAVVDGGLLEADPGVVDRLRRYASVHDQALCLAAPPMIVPGGEDAKNDPALVTLLHGWLDELRIDRQSVIVVVGGGAVLDMAGFAAATAHRGVRVVRVPTTVLSQCDSGVGVKNGVNAFDKKNFVGTFAPPFAVVNDAAFLDSLDRRDRIAGMAEAVKVGLVRDRAFFRWIADHASALAAGDVDALARLIRESAALHLEHIRTSGDPFELGSARPLDFGHWAAHKLERLTRHGLRHGECVAIGMAIDTVYASRVGLCSTSVREEVLSTLEALGLPIWDDALRLLDGEGRSSLLAGIDEFREHLGGELTVTLLSDVGVGLEVHVVDENMVVLAVEDLRRRIGR